MKGWRVQDVNGIVSCYVRAESVTDAKKVARDNEPSSTLGRGYDWINMRVRRAPEFDERLSEVLMQEHGHMCIEFEGEACFATDDDEVCVCVHSC